MARSARILGGGSGGGASLTSSTEARFLVFIGLPGHESKRPDPGPAQLSAGLELEPEDQWVRAGTELSHFLLSELCSLGRTRGAER